MKLKDLGQITLIVALYGIVMAMAITISQYFSFKSDVGFLLYKQSLIQNKFWVATFYIHVFTCIICLFAGLTQFSKLILHNYPRLHRLFGRIYFYNIVLINFPAGVILAIYANGNMPGKLAFLTLAFLWLYFTVSAVFAIKKGNVQKHKEHMIRSYSLTLSAITLRLLKAFMSEYSNWSYNQIYIFDAWTALFLNLIIAELVIYYQIYRSKRKLIRIK